MLATLLRLLSFLGVLGILAVSPAFAAAKRDLGAEAKAIFQVKCVQCHGPDVRKPKGDFGYVLDLKRLAADSEKVVPGKPDESQLWQLVHDDEMPAEGAKAGPVTKEQKETIRAWIEAGAPPPSTEKDAPSSPAPQPKKHFLDWLGNFHVIVIHFPIALLLAAAVGELWYACRSVRQPASAVSFCVLLGAISAVVSAALGWLHAANGAGAGSPSILTWHRWFGTTTAAGSVILLVLSAIDIRRGVRSWWFRLLLLLAAVLVGVTGYFGGDLVYGEGYFRW
ncbi:MAG TPA: DUF2231 domain-containing protein [Gemmataceae bacterium]|nr:DUF2231 domain-containing protein [Gemmataceae bacterium]